MNISVSGLGQGKEVMPSDFIEYRGPTPLVDQYENLLSRKREVHVVADTHGSKQALVQSLITLDDIERKDGKYIWKGGIKDVVGLGDMVFDRNDQGFENLKLWHELQPQIIDAGGSLHVTLANHEKYFLDFLLGDDIEAIKECFLPKIWGILGMSELFTRVNFTGSSEARNLWKDIPIWVRDWMKEHNSPPSVEEIPQHIQENFFRVIDVCWENRKSIQDILLKDHPYVIEMLSSMKINVQIDDAIFTHTNPTSAMVKRLLEEKDMNAINTGVRKDLEASLFGYLNPVSLDTQKLFQMFLSAKNRDNFICDSNSQEMSSNLQARGYNTWVYGHTDEKKAPYLYPEDFKRNNFTLVPVDFSAFKNGQDTGIRSVVKILTNGSVLIFDRFRRAV